MVKPSARVSLDSLVDLACRDGVDIRPTLLRVLTDLYVQKPAHGAEEETQYVELALGLIETVDAQTRAAVAATLSAYPGAPQAVLRKLASLASLPEGFPGRSARESNDLLELFFAARPEERRLILVNLDVVAEPAAYRPMPAASELIRRLEYAALQGSPGEFARVLERALDISRELASRITRDYFGEPIVVAAKALGMQGAVLQRILLFLNPVIGQSVERVYQLSGLFDELKPAAAHHMLAIWRTATVRTRTTHASTYEPVYWDDERRNIRSPSIAPSQRPAERDTRPARIKTSKN
jgi:hypothetical protein